MQGVMSALHPIADMCGATSDVCFVPIADSCSAANSPHKHLFSEHEQRRWGAQRGRDGAST